MQVHAADPIYHTGNVELVGTDDQVDQNDYSASVNLLVEGSGELLAIKLVTGESGSGSVIAPTGTLVFFYEDPEVDAGDTSITNAEALTVLGLVEVESEDWLEDDNAAIAYIVDTPIAYHQTDGGLWVAFLLTGATGFNDAGGDDEFMQIDVWYRKDK